MTKVFIATPAYDGSVYVPYAVSLAETFHLLEANGIKCQIAINCSGSLLVAERNRLLKQFLASDCTHMLCIDSDLGWAPQAVIAMILKDEDFVAGVYPTRREMKFLFRPIVNEDGSLVVSEKKLIEMEAVPAGFMLIKRAVIEKLIEDNKHLYFQPKNPEEQKNDGYCIFNTELIDGEFWGEDYVFCLRAKASGFKIWVDPCVEFDHAGQRGMLLSVLTDKPQS